jgi:hypothetical protein
MCEKIVDILNREYPDAKLEHSGLKFPAMKKGFVGDAVPYFSLENAIVWNIDFHIAEHTISTGETFRPSMLDEHPSTTHIDHDTTTTATTSNTTADNHESHTTPAVVTGTTPAPPATTTTTNDHPSPNRDHLYGHNQPLPVTEDPFPQASIATLPAPRRLTGWMKKQGHVAKNWKTRFFVLDHGFLTYYVDQQEKPPYGIDRKGQICLAGYREKSLMKDNYGDNNNNINNGIDLHSDDNEEDGTYEHQHDSAQANSIHLQFYPEIVDAQVSFHLFHTNE